MPNPAIWLADNPRVMLEILHKAAKEVALEEFESLYANYSMQDVFVRFTDMPLGDSIRDIRCCTISCGQGSHLRDSTFRLHNIERICMF